MEYNLKSGASGKVILSKKLDAKMTPPRVFRVLMVAIYHSLFR